MFPTVSSNLSSTGAPELLAKTAPKTAALSIENKTANSKPRRIHRKAPSPPGANQNMGLNVAANRPVKIDLECFEGSSSTDGPM